VRQASPGALVAGGPRRAEVIAAGWLFDTDLPDGAWAALGDDLAPGGYAYLLVHGGRGTLSACLFHRFSDVKACARRARAVFEGRLGLRLRGARPFGGIGNAGVPATAVAGGVLLAGEAAGFQDPLWGFGIRHALVSGHLAASAALAGGAADYDRLWRQRLGGTMRASTVLRFFYGRMGDRGYRLLLAAMGRSPDPRSWLHRRYRPSRWKRALFPLVRGRALRMAGRDGHGALPLPVAAGSPTA
jgi:flavin-dependent dehydrogenase